MARTAAIRKAETWVYIEDEQTEVSVEGKKEKRTVPVVKEIGAGQKPPGGGSAFQLGPMPHEIYLELGFYGSRRRAALARAKRHFDSAGELPIEGEETQLSTLIARATRECVIGWAWVVDGDGQEIAFDGPQSVALLDVETKSILGFHLLAQFDEKAGKRGNASARSEGTRSKRRSSGRATAE